MKAVTQIRISGTLRKIAHVMRLAINVMCKMGVTAYKLKYFTGCATEMGNKNRVIN